MKKIMLSALISFSSLAMGAQEPIYSVSSSQFLPVQKTPTPAKEAVSAKSAQGQGSSEIMIIPPEARAKDFSSAFQYLKKLNPSSKIVLKLTNGSTLTNILDMEVMPGGTMIIFKTNSIQGQQLQVVKIEDVDTLTHE